MLRKLSGILLISFLLLLTLAWNKPDRTRESGMQHWVDSVFTSLTPEQQLGQLFMVDAYSNQGEKQRTKIDELIKEYNIGGLIFFQGGPERQAKLTNHYQSISKTPLFIAMDAEWGLSMRLDSTLYYPKQMTLGALPGNELIYKMGSQIAQDCRRLGVQINFAPVVDVNSNPANPVIGVRSFGEDQTNVAAKGVAYMSGLQDNFVMACAKHFPGHGDASSDSHLTLPLIDRSKKEMDEVDLYPFKALIDKGIKSIMAAHLYVPAYDNTPNLPSSLSKKVVTDLLKKDLKFKGLVFTDALNMKGVTRFYKPGELEVQALLAGNDVLLFSEDISTALKKIQKALKKGILSQELIDTRVKKILAAKYWAKLNKEKFVNETNLYADLNTPKAKALQRGLYQKALTVVKNDKELIPVQIIDTTSFASLTIGLNKGNSFQETLSNYAPFTHFNIADKNADTSIYNNMLSALSGYETVIVGICNTTSNASNDYGITKATRDFVEALQKSHKNVILSVFASPYSLKFFPNSTELICAYEDNAVTRSLVPQLIFGAFKATGKLPVSIEPYFPLGTGIETAALYRLQYALPESAGMDSKTLATIDSIAARAIANEATPGMQVVVAKGGKVVYNKSFGYLTYDKKEPVTAQTVYDVASITKVAGTLQAIMFLYDRGEIDLDKKASFYLPMLRGSNKEDLRIRDILTHQSGLIPFIPHWKKTMDTGALLPTYYQPVESDSFPNEVCPGLFSCASIKDSMWQWTIDSDLLEKKKNEPYHYVYSDLGFYIMKHLAEKLLNQPIAEFVEQNFYQPLGASILTYKPLEKFPVEQIAPTENDTYFRNTQIRGTVHDQGAAMLGGVGGHAGLFANANSLAILFQMNLQNGYYGGQRYFLPETVPTFAKKQFETNRRGLGWDKLLPDGNGPTSDFVSPKTFGHTGFTGTSAWADPEQDLVYIFLSNRVYPDCSNEKLVTNDVRTDIQDVIYKSILNYTYQ